MFFKQLFDPASSTLTYREHGLRVESVRT